MAVAFWFGYKYRGIAVWEALLKRKLSVKCVHRATLAGCPTTWQGLCIGAVNL